ncbi:hypothetical protein, partial [Pantoea endophytica]|uniref:hypothetical protein n=1 Tax=Pantoea endophytica TaxID=92488 RepID=UPI0035E3E5C9
VVVWAVSLDQFGEAVTPVTWLVNAGLVTSVRDPQSGGSHPAAKCLNRNRNPVTLLKLFCSKCGPETDVIFA